MSQQLPIKDLQEKLLDMMKEIDRICQKENIQYFVTGGTFLGAVRHKGFIPWDDDIDIGMDRKNYEKFLSKLKDNLPSNFKLDYYTNNDSEVPWVKILDYKVIQTDNTIDNITIEQYLFIDIFPFDNIPDNKILRNIFRIQIYFKTIKLRLAKSRWLSKSTNQIFAKKFKNLITKIINMKIFDNFLNYRKVLGQYDKLIKKYQNKETKMISDITVDYKLKKIFRECIDRDKAYQIVNYDFEDTQFKGMKDYDTYLTKIYGDYMKLPPENERIAKHFIKVIKCK